MARKEEEKKRENNKVQFMKVSNITSILYVAGTPTAVVFIMWWWVVKMVNIVPIGGIEPTSLAFWASVLNIP